MRPPSTTPSATQTMRSSISVGVGCRSGAPQVGIGRQALGVEPAAQEARPHRRAHTSGSRRVRSRTRWGRWPGRGWRIAAWGEPSTGQAPPKPSARAERPQLDRGAPDRQPYWKRSPIGSARLLEALACCEALAKCPHRTGRPRWPAHSRDRPMAQTSNRLMDELARLATDAVGAAQGVRREVETVARSQMERLIRRHGRGHPRRGGGAARDGACGPRRERGAQCPLRAVEERLGTDSVRPEPARTRVVAARTAILISTRLWKRRSPLWTGGRRCDCGPGTNPRSSIAALKRGNPEGYSRSETDSWMGAGFIGPHLERPIVNPFGAAART